MDTLTTGMALRKKSIILGQITGLTEILKGIQILVLSISVEKPVYKTNFEFEQELLVRRLIQSLKLQRLVAVS